MELFCHTDGVTLFVSRRCNLRAGTILCQLRLASAYLAVSVDSKPFKWEVVSFGAEDVKFVLEVQPEQSGLF